MSVVIPAYRGGPLLRQAVQSMLDQSFENLEVLVVSDGSDDPMEDLESLDPRVRLFRCEHRGVSAARNTGLLESRGRFVAFLDEDDLAMEGRVAAQFEALSNRPDAAIAHGRVQVVDEGGRQVGPLRGGPTTYPDMLRARFLHMTSLMVSRREAIIAGGFDAMLVTGEDIDFQLRLARDHAMVFIPEVLTRYRLHADNTKIDPLMAQQVIGPILREHRRCATQMELAELASAAADGMRSNRRTNATAAYRRAEQAYTCGEIRESGRYLVMSLKIDPRVTLKAALRSARDRLGRAG